MSEFPYDTRLNVLHNHLEVIDLPFIMQSINHPWFNQTLCRVNESVVRLGVVKGEYHWHKHDDLDEFFYCVEGKFIIEFESRTVELDPMQAIVVPKGVLHRPRASSRTIVLMVEGAGIVPTGDV